MLLKEKLTRERFFQLVNRFMLLGLIGFVLLVSIAGLGYVFAYKIQAVPSVDYSGTRPLALARAQHQ